jgi:hypothetical protein
MKTAKAHLVSVTPYSQSRPFGSAKQRDETHAAFEERCWRERCHVDKDGQIFIPPMAFKNCLDAAAKYKSIQIPGKGKATYTKHFESGVLCMDPLNLGIQLTDVEGEWLFVPSDGRPGGGSRVWKCFPLIRQWSGVVTFYVFDEMIDQDTFEKHLIDAGQFIGIGRFRPKNRGYYGRFEVKAIDWA